MSDDLARAYNYDTFEPANFERWMTFDTSPGLGVPGPDFPLWTAGGDEETRLSAILRENRYTVVEFGSFT